MKNFKHRPLFAQNLPKEVTKPKIEWKILPVVWLALKRMATVLGFFVLLQLFITVFIIIPVFMTTADITPMPEKMVLYLEFDGAINEINTTQGFADAFDTPPLTLREMVDVIHFAGTDSRVKGIFARMKNAQISLTQAYELNQALEDFKSKGKFAHIYASSYGQAAQGLGNYALIAGFDEIWMQPMGTVSITGLNAEMPFLGKTLDRIGVEPNFFQRKEYKNLYENLTETKMSRESRETISRLITDIRNDILTTIPPRIGVDAAQFDGLVNQGLFTAEEAKQAGLITHADYADILVENIKEAVTGNRNADDDIFVMFDDYAAEALEHFKASELLQDDAKVALIYAVGTILRSDEGSGFGGGPTVAAAEDIAPAILDAADDDDVRVIIMRVDSPGGSPVASESILRAIERAKRKGKKVIVTMGATAASGGYWISAYADQIFVMPSTITGSIGVVGGKIALGELFENIGVNWDGVTWGRNAGMWSLDSTFSKSEAERVNTMLDAVYDGFIARVAKGRGMSSQAVDAIAGGRVWTGARAVEIGLADQIGGLNDALDYTAKELGVQSRYNLHIDVLPKPKTPFEKLIELVEGQAMLGQVVKKNQGVLDAIGSFSDMVHIARNPNDFMVFEELHLR